MIIDRAVSTGLPLLLTACLLWASAAQSGEDGRHRNGKSETVSGIADGTFNIACSPVSNRHARKVRWIDDCEDTARALLTGLLQQGRLCISRVPDEPFGEAADNTRVLISDRRLRYEISEYAFTASFRLQPDCESGD